MTASNGLLIFEISLKLKNILKILFKSLELPSYFTLEFIF